MVLLHTVPVRTDDRGFSSGFNFNLRLWSTGNNCCFEPNIITCTCMAPPTHRAQSAVLFVKLHPDR
jgi:hypothetical protein